MLWTIFVVLLVLWLLGVVSAYTVGGFIHILLVLAIVTVLIQLIQGRRACDPPPEAGEQMLPEARRGLAPAGSARSAHAPASNRAIASSSSNRSRPLTRRANSSTDAGAHAGADARGLAHPALDGIEREAHAARGALDLVTRQIQGSWCDAHGALRFLADAVQPIGDPVQVFNEPGYPR